jgi:ribonuclease D
MTIRLHRGDLPDLARYGASVAIDTETLGLNPHRDRLCVVQLSPGDGSADVVQIAPGQNEAPNLVKLLTDPAVTKIFHFARFDVAVLGNAFGIEVAPIYCTKIASRLTRTYTDRHGLKDLVKELLDVDLSKQQQSSDWAAERLTDAQLAYAASDVLYLHALKKKLDERLARENRTALARPASASCRPARRSILRDGRKRISLRIPEPAAADSPRALVCVVKCPYCRRL